MGTDKAVAEPFSNLKLGDRVYPRLVKLYTFAHSFAAPDFSNAVMIELQRLLDFRISNSDDQRGLPSLPVVEFAVEKLGTASGLSRYLAACYGDFAELFKYDTEAFARLPSKFLAMVLVQAFGRVREVINGDSDLLSRSEWCKYHEHADEEAREACQEVIDPPLRMWRGFPCA